MILVLIAKTQLSFWTRQLTLVTAAYFYLDHSGTDTNFVGKKNLVIIGVVYFGYLQKKNVSIYHWCCHFLGKRQVKCFPYTTCFKKKRYIQEEVLCQWDVTKGNQCISKTRTLQWSLWDRGSDRGGDDLIKHLQRFFKWVSGFKNQTGLWRGQRKK